MGPVGFSPDANFKTATAVANHGPKTQNLALDTHFHKLKDGQYTDI